VLTGRIFCVLLFFKNSTWRLLVKSMSPSLRFLLLWLLPIIRPLSEMALPQTPFLLFLVAIL